MKQRPHAELIRQWADGCEIQYRKDADSKWVDSPDPAWLADYEYRVKPAGPEYPTSKMDDGIFFAILSGKHPAMNITAGYRAIANAALRHAIDAGQVVTREEFDRAIGDRKVRDMAIAEAVRSAGDAALRALREGDWIHSAMPGLNLAAIIAEVKL